MPTERSTLPVLETPRVTEPKQRSRSWALATRLVLPLSLLIGWTLLAKSSLVPPLALPTPWGTLLELKAMYLHQDLVFNIGVSLARALLGLLLGAGVGFIIGLIAGLSTVGEDLFDSTLQMLRAVPFIALVPLFILWFGIGETPKILVIALASYFPMYLNTARGVRNVDRKVVESAKSFGLRGLSLVRRVLLPLALPQILTGLSLSMMFSVLALVAAEQISSQNGIGYLLIQSQSFQRNYEVFACVVLYALMGLCASAIVKLLEHFLLPWRKGVAVR